MAGETKTISDQTRGATFDDTLGCISGSESTDDIFRAWLHLANLQLSPRLIAALLRAFGSDPQAIFAASDRDLDDIEEMRAAQLLRLRDPLLEPTARQMAVIEQLDVRILWQGHSDFPSVLAEMQDAPALLFVRGTLQESDRFGIGIVGSRGATPYGKAAAERFARELAGHGLTVISGGAIGIDTAAHRGALSGGGRTLAVLGCGLDVDYPRPNRLLFDEIVQNGALISEYPLGAQPESWRFPHRNRVISALSQGVLVVEAPERSGALNTVSHAVEQGRVVMAVPGNIDRPASVGTNQLIKDGHIVVTETEDILRAVGMVVLSAPKSIQTFLDIEGSSEPAVYENEDQGADRGGISHRSTLSVGEAERRAAASASRTHLLQALTAEQCRVVETLSLTPQHIDTIAQAAGLSASDAGVAMFHLEMAGFIKRLPGNAYIRTL